MTTSLGHRPKGAWEFDADVAECFDDMLRRSIPEHEAMRDVVTSIAVDAARRIAGPIADLGSSRGEALARVLERAPDATCFAFERSEPMRTVLHERFAAKRDAGRFFVVPGDLRDPATRLSLPMGGAATLSVLTLQFVPINYRQAIVRDVHRRLASGGAFVLVEKVLGATAEIDALMVERYHALKGSNGYGVDEIERKRLSLEGVLVPVTARWNEDLLAQAGFRDVDCVWRWMNFAAWVAIR
jgi:tRNA (cmo5U34)-methyltransferase